MTVKNQFKIVNNDNSKGLKFAWAESFSDNITFNNVTFSQSGSDSSSNYAANWGGNKRLISVDFVLQNDGTDKSTSSDNKVTLSQQRQFLMDTVAEGFSTSQNAVTFTISVYEDGATVDYSGVLENITVSASPSASGVFLRGNLTLFRGTN